MSKRYGRNRRRKDREFVASFMAQAPKTDFAKGIIITNDLPADSRKAAKAIRISQENIRKFVLRWRDENAG